MALAALNNQQYEQLLAFRVTLRRFLRWSKEQVAAVGLTPAQHQLLLVVRGRPDPRGPTIGEVASDLLIRHHSAVQLADRVEALGLIRRRRDEDDRRVVRLRLTRAGERRVAAISAAHLEQIRRLAAAAAAVARPDAAEVAKRQHADDDGCLPGERLGHSTCESACP
jgi:DNA-binding MarR family transcriptional regulator